jgi:hypothetical protein
LDGYPVTFEPITIGKNVWLPWRVFILPGTTIGDNVVIGANSLVSKNIPSNVLIAGSPAKIIKENYPATPDLTQKNTILNNIIAEFITYIQYYGFSVEQQIHENGLNVTVSKKSKKSHIELIRNGPVITDKNDKIIIQDYQDDISKITLPKSLLIINLQTRQRKGTSEIGEELIKFLSRYGIRFNRID